MDSYIDITCLGHCSIMYSVFPKEEPVIQNHIHIPVEKLFSNAPD